MFDSSNNYEHDCTSIEVRFSEVPVIEMHKSIFYDIEIASLTYMLHTWFIAKCESRSALVNIIIIVFEVLY